MFYKTSRIHFAIHSTHTHQELNILYTRQNTQPSLYNTKPIFVLLKQSTKSQGHYRKNALINYSRTSLPVIAHIENLTKLNHLRTGTFILATGA